MRLFFTNILPVIVFPSLVLAACSSSIPPQIKDELPGSPLLTEVHGHTEDFISQYVRWGGAIISVENKEKASWLTIVALPLNDYGEPRSSDQSPGRFIAVFNEFLEPRVYTADRLITIAGRIRKSETRKIGDFLYNYPVIEVEQYHLWPLPPDPSELDYPPYWWYDPYYPWQYPHWPYHRW